ncbi:hypothetical protein ABDD95_04720 [Mucilaginibacter sp. PAMB04274]
MKSTIKTGLFVLALTSMLAACKGGFSGDKQDSTMLDRERNDSIARLNSETGKMAADSNSAAKQDTNGLDSSAYHKNK